jgi:hypothetical protein
MVEVTLGNPNILLAIYINVAVPPFLRSYPPSRRFKVNAGVFDVVGGSNGLHFATAKLTKLCSRLISRDASITFTASKNGVQPSPGNSFIGFAP